MVLVWIFYAQFAIMTFMWQRRPRIVIDQTEDRSVHTRFVLVNLSELPVLISCVMMVVRRGKEETVHKVTTYERQADGENHTEYEQAVERHGTLAPSQLLMIGSSEETLSWLLQDDADDDVDEPRDRRVARALREVDEFEIRIVAMVGTDDRPVASARRFEIERTDEGVQILPKDSYTQHFSSWRSRRTAVEWSDYCMRN